MLSFRGDKRGFTTDVVVLAVSLVVFAIVILVFFFLFKIEGGGLVSGNANKVSFNGLYAKTALLNVLRTPVDDSRVGSVNELESPFSLRTSKSIPRVWYDNKTVGQFLLFMGDKIKTKKDLDDYKSEMRLVLLSTLYDSAALDKCKSKKVYCAKDLRPRYCFGFEVVKGDEKFGPVQFNVNKHFNAFCGPGEAEFIKSLSGGGAVVIKMLGYKP